MENACPNCKGTAFLQITGSDGRTVTICSECEAYIPAAAPDEASIDGVGPTELWT